MMQPRNPVLLMVISLSLMPPVLGRVKLSIRLTNFTNHGGQLPNMHCCGAVPSGGCSGNCSHRIKLCLDYAESANVSRQLCPLGEHTSDIIPASTTTTNFINRNNNSNITYNTSFETALATWPDALRVKIDVVDADSTIGDGVIESVNKNYFRMDKNPIHSILGRLIRLGVVLTMTCGEDWEGPRCERWRSPCSNSPCLNRAKCIADERTLTYKCECDDRHKGEFCEEKITCADYPCGNATSGCDDDDERGFICSCHFGWSGERCLIEVDICETYSYSPCFNGGACQETRAVDWADYECECPPGWTGRTCEENVNECEGESPCNEETHRCEDTPGSYQCVCHNGGHGDNCIVTTTTEQTTARDACHGDPCKNEGSCAPIDDVNYACTCLPGYTGRDCDVIDHCQPNPCHQNQTCENTEIGFRCQCNPGRGGERCDDYVTIPYDQQDKSARAPIVEAGNILVTLGDPEHDDIIEKVKDASIRVLEQADQSEIEVEVFPMICSHRGSLKEGQFEAAYVLIKDGEKVMESEKVMRIMENVTRGSENHIIQHQEGTTCRHKQMYETNLAASTDGETGGRHRVVLFSSIALVSLVIIILVVVVLSQHHKGVVRKREQEKEDAEVKSKDLYTAIPDADIENDDVTVVMGEHVIKAAFVNQKTASLPRHNDYVAMPDVYY